MTVPLDRLYHFLDDVVNDDLIIYRWSPHGSRLLDDMRPLKNYKSFAHFTTPIVLCHDQEPTDYNLYSEEDRFNSIIKQKSANMPYTRQQFEEMNNEYKYTDNYIQELLGHKLNIYNKYILLHSEKNSEAINDYVQHDAVPVYYFSHALIARDWFRYAEIDPLIFKKNVKQDFLIYQRAWTGSREYRLKFLELLINSGIYSQCLSRFNPLDDNGKHYRTHQYKNKTLQIERNDLESYFPANNSPSSSSADYSVEDYCQTRFEVVLETLFDDRRQHLTEKIFRPIACGQPFILASTPGALSYLRSYGFKTFGDYIDESYDNVADPVERLHAILSTMKSIAMQSHEEKELLSSQLQNVVEFNRNWFFSREFVTLVVNEYKSNLGTGLDVIRQHQGACLNRWEILRLKGIAQKIITEQEYKELLKKI
jgi:hypothetical protein